jgi:hypothetical protein
MRSALVLLALALAGCSADPPPPAHHPEKKPRVHREHDDEPRGPSGPRPSGGSSDGVSCDEARDANVDEVAIGKKGGGKDLSARDLGAVLNDGAYLGECDVPQSVKVSVCAAVKNGAALGVTVAMSPHDEALEKCVSAKIRALAFPSSPKLDVVKTEF